MQQPFYNVGCSTTVGGNCSGRERICFIVSENNVVCASQPDFMCSAKCHRLTRGFVATN